MATKFTNRIKATVWTPTMKSEIDGNIVGVIHHLLWSVPTAKGRASVRAEMDKVFAKLDEIDRLGQQQKVLEQMAEPQSAGA